jgi:hypothetical protein
MCIIYNEKGINKFIDFESSRLFKSKKTVADRILNAQELVRLFSLISSMKKEIRISIPENNNLKKK